MNTFAEIFTSANFWAVNFLRSRARGKRHVISEALAMGISGDGKTLDGGGNGATAYADAIAVYLGLRSARQQIQ